MKINKVIAFGVHPIQMWLSHIKMERDDDAPKKKI
jgi:hypothetical protein